MRGTALELDAALSRAGVVRGTFAAVHFAGRLHIQAVVDGFVEDRIGEVETSDVHCDKSPDLFGEPI